MTMSLRPTYGRASSPGFAPLSGSSTRMPVWSSLTPSSRPEQIMPLDACPYVLRAEISNPPGSTPPGRMTATRSPTSKLVAPHTISCGLPVPFASPTSTVQNRIGFLNPVSSSMVSTRPTTRGPCTVVAWSTTDSTSMPRLLSVRSSCSAVRSAGRSTYSRNQDSPTRISVHLHAERSGEPHVALAHLPHVAEPIAEHQGAFDAHAEGESGVHLRVEAAGPQDVGVDHPAAAPLHPPWTVTVFGDPDVEPG